MSYIIRQGRKGDKPATGWAGPEKIPDYVLLHKEQQIGALHGSFNFINHIEIFEPYQNQNHGTKFVELIEQEAKRQGHEKIVYNPVTNPRLERILKKLSYLQDKSDKEKYVKKISS